MKFAKIDGFSIRDKIAAYERLYRVEKPIEDRPPHQHIENLFDIYVEKFGGQKISDKIENKSVMEKNADYIFEDFNIIAELKTLEGIYAGPNSIAQLRQACIDSGLPRDGMYEFILSGDELPEIVTKLVQRRLRRALEQRIKKARAQLRQSKQSFGNADTQTLIIFAMDQTPLFGHYTILLNLAKLMSDNYADEHTDGIVYINPNTPTRLREDGMEFAGWFPFYRDETVNRRLSSFVNEFGNQWLQYYATQIKNTNPIIELTSPDDMLAVLRPDRS